MAVRRLLPSRCAIAVIDVQERLAAAMPAERLAGVTKKIGVLLAAAERLGAVALATEQYAKGLGPTIEPLAGQLRALRAPVFEKMTFSAMDAPEFAKRIDEIVPAAVVVVGIETHVCVYQTVRDLAGRGIEVHVPTDAVLSRHDEDRTAGLALCDRAGAVITTTETIVFDWLARAGTDTFRAISPLLR